MYDVCEIELETPDREPYLQGASPLLLLLKGQGHHTPAQAVTNLLSQQVQRLLHGAKGARHLQGR